MPRIVLIAFVAATIVVAGCISSIPFLSGAPPSFMTKCTTDTDCVAVCAAKDCCCACKDTAINKKYLAEWDFGNAKYCQLKNASCATVQCDHSSAALCISGSCIINKTAVEQP